MTQTTSDIGEVKVGDLYVLPNSNVIVIEQVIDQVPIVISTQEAIENKLYQINSLNIPVVEDVKVVQEQSFDVKKYYESIQVRQWMDGAFKVWNSCDSDIAFHITEFKRQYVFPIGDIPVRSVLMAVSTGLTYALLGRINPSFFGRARNLGLNFVLNGSFWLPELFNPFLFLQTRQ